MGITVTNQNFIDEEIKRRLNSDNACYHSVQNLLFSHLPSKTANIKFRAVAQAVSRQLPTAAAGVQSQARPCGMFVVDKVALGQFFSDNFGFPCNSFHDCSMFLLSIILGWYNRPNSG
jgi:hypothetical protein